MIIYSGLSKFLVSGDQVGVIKVWNHNFTCLLEGKIGSNPQKQVRSTKITSLTVLENHATPGKDPIFVASDA